MAGIASIGCGGMSCRFSSGDRIIVTSYTSTNDLTMIQRSNKGQPCQWRYIVTKLAGICGWRVISWFTSSRDVVVTSDAASNYLAMIKWCNVR